ncbi:sulfite reductase flavoprotein subunit alpha [Phanerochaete sordida]|uniref:NADPH-dependent diflavin oxidoreductase 1 n=1 Tax=Phanerochaete sordida TaxID=48140 RepID=A0A9P3GES5_9APHY|nr:sulfite reductase flavoprotein subunit alpha [Phanerochaete sordida]
MSVHDHDELDERELTILYATETGNAQDVAERLARLCRRLHFRVRLCSIDEYQVDDIFSTHLIIFVISTTGSGREPRSMTRFWTSLLRGDLPSDLFDHLDFTIFGLGDTAYEKFCWPAKMLERRLLQLGATKIVDRGDADDQHPLGIDGALDPWMRTLSDTLLSLFPLPPGLEVKPDGLPEPRASVTEPEPAAVPPDAGSFQGYYTATVARNTRITDPEWYQDVRHFDLDFDADLEYAPGDIAVVAPEAPADDVEAFLQCVGWLDEADTPFAVKHVLPDQSLPARLPRTLTLRALFTRYLDINAVPRRSFFSLLRHFTSDELELEKLDEFLSSEGADDLYDYCQSVHRRIREVFEEFRSAKVPKDYLFDLFPPLRPREFSIASSSLRNPRRIELCVAIVKYRTKLKIPRRGVATTYLAALQPGDKLHIRLKKGIITLPPDKATPIICVGPGTGIAPMRAVIEERVAQGAKANTLYQGCRSASKDQHYREEFTRLTEAAQLEYRVACSRDGPPGVKRTYVQDLIAADAERIWELLGARGAWLYISGSSNKMPAAVRAAVQGALEQYGQKTEAEAKEFIADMERGGKLVEDCWD